MVVTSLLGCCDWQGHTEGTQQQQQSGWQSPAGEIRPQVGSEQGLHIYYSQWLIIHMPLALVSGSVMAHAHDTSNKKGVKSAAQLTGVLPAEVGTAFSYVAIFSWACDIKTRRGVWCSKQRPLCDLGR